MAEKLFSGSCSDIPSPLLQLFEAEDGEIDASFEDGESIDYVNLKQNVSKDEFGKKQTRSPLATSSEDSYSSNDDRSFYSTENGHIREPKVKKEPLDDVVAECPIDNVQDSNGSDFAFLPKCTIISIENDGIEQDRDGNMIEEIQLPPKTNEKVTENGDESHKTLKRKNSENATPKLGAKQSKRTDG